MNEALANFADQDGLSLKEFKEKIESESKSFVLFREEMKAEMIKRRVQSGLVGPKVVISEEEVMNYINSAEGENLFSIEYKINQILLKNDDEEDLKKAKAIINEIENGLSFEEAQKKLLIII